MAAGVWRSTPERPEARLADHARLHLWPLDSRAETLQAGDIREAGRRAHLGVGSEVTQVDAAILGERRAKEKRVPDSRLTRRAE